MIIVRTAMTTINPTRTLALMITPLETAFNGMHAQQVQILVTQDTFGMYCGQHTESLILYYCNPDTVSNQLVRTL